MTDPQKVARYQDAMRRWEENEERRRLKERAELMSNATREAIDREQCTPWGLRIEQLSSQGTCTMTTRETAGDMRLWPGMRTWFPALAQEALAEQATQRDPLAPMSLEEWRK